jgi:hypothetical protein
MLSFNERSRGRRHEGRTLAAQGFGRGLVASTSCPIHEASIEHVYYSWSSKSLTTYLSSLFLFLLDILLSGALASYSARSTWLPQCASHSAGVPQLSYAPSCLYLSPLWSCWPICRYWCRACRASELRHLQCSCVWVCPSSESLKCLNLVLLHYS